MAELTEDQKLLLNQVIKEHPDWEPLQIRAEFFARLIRQSPGYIDDHHVLPALIQAVQAVQQGRA